VRVHQIQRKLLRGDREGDRAVARVFLLRVVRSAAYRVSTARSPACDGGVGSSGIWVKGVRGVWGDGDSFPIWGTRRWFG
jgi:hypothetical protein